MDRMDTFLPTPKIPDPLNSLCAKDSTALLVGVTEYVGFDFNSRQHRLLRDRDRIRSGVRQPMSPVETVLGGVCAVLLGVYLIYTMLRPERF
ncbi:K(+)-transporting ATPase subunit F [Candidatus Binatus sp.]|uniref:K(+)-transporting ATPase subunit F n=1 Tax=Candidatus Binatus sp. TaxID=2811406 RepID=UPI003CC64DB3